MNKTSRTMSSDGLTLQDEDIVKERDYVVSVFDKQTPEMRNGLSLIVSNISKVFLSKA